MLKLRLEAATASDGPGDGCSDSNAGLSSGAFGYRLNCGSFSYGLKSSGYSYGLESASFSYGEIGDGASNAPCGSLAAAPAAGYQVRRHPEAYPSFARPQDHVLRCDLLLHVAIDQHLQERVIGYGLVCLAAAGQHQQAIVAAAACLP